jgi:hypothetical protein
MNKSLIILTTILVGLLFALGCESDAQTGALIGTGIGAGVGALAGGSTEGTLIGAAVGGGAGYMLGNEGDKKKAEADRGAIRQEMNTVTVWVTNSNSSRIPVNLTKSGPNYIGPRGEQYDHLPTSEELRPVYGF